MKNEIRAFLLSEDFVSNHKVDHLEDDTLLLEAGLIESFNIINLVLFLEKRFGIEVNSNDLLGNNFSSVNSIENFVKKKLENAEKKQ